MTEVRLPKVIKDSQIQRMIIEEMGTVPDPMELRAAILITRTAFKILGAEIVDDLSVTEEDDLRQTDDD